MKQQASRFRQAVLLRARDVYMRSIGRSTLAASLLLVQQLLCLFFASGVSDRMKSLSLVISGYSFNWAFHVILFAIYALFGPIMLGVTEFFVMQLHSSSGKFLNIFNWFSDPDKMKTGLKFGLLQSSIIVFGQILSEIPSFIIFKSGIPTSFLTAPPPVDSAAAQELLAYSGAIFSAALFYLLSFLIQIPLLRLLATEYLLVGSPQMKFSKALRESNSIMKGKIGSFMLTILKVLPIIFFMSACGFFFFIGYGFYFMVRSSFVDTLIISRFMERSGDLLAADGASELSPNTVPLTPTEDELPETEKDSGENRDGEDR